MATRSEDTFGDSPRSSPRSQAFASRSAGCSRIERTFPNPQVGMQKHGVPILLPAIWSRPGSSSGDSATFPGVLLFIQTQTLTSLTLTAENANVPRGDRRYFPGRRAFREPYEDGPGQQDLFGSLSFGLGDLVCLLPSVRPSVLAALIKSLPRLLRRPSRLRGRCLRHSARLMWDPQTDARLRDALRDAELCLFCSRIHRGVVCKSQFHFLL